MKLAVVIPTYRPHFIYLADILKGCAEQTRVPDFVVISASSVEGEEEKELLNNLELRNYPFELKILKTAAKQATGKNRNDAAAVAINTFGADILLFYDADDIMHERRTEFIEAVFKEDPAIDGVVHSFFSIESREGPIPWKIYNGLEHIQVTKGGEELKREELYVPFTKEIVSHYRPTFVDSNGGDLLFHDGHFSIRSKVIIGGLELMTQNHLYQDNKFVADCIFKGHPIAHLAADLTAYYCPPNRYADVAKEGEELGLLPNQARY